jgi:hypothetical protein
LIIKEDITEKAPNRIESQSSPQSLVLSLWPPLSFEPLLVDDQASDPFLLAVSSVVQIRMFIATDTNSQIAAKAFRLQIPAQPHCKIRKR